jgi:hypothetical protein
MRPESRAWRRLGLSFLAGAVVDAAFGFAILAAAESLAPLMRLTLPVPRVYLDLNGLLLLALAGVYVLVWRQPRRLAPVAAAATLLRFGGAALFASGVALGRAEPTFLFLAALDGGLAVVHLALLRRAAGGLLPALVDPSPEPPYNHGSSDRSVP